MLYRRAYFTLNVTLVTSGQVDQNHAQVAQLAGFTHAG